MRLRNLSLGIRSLKAHKLRSLLTILGTILGVASVISMLAVGEGSKQHALEQIRKLGAANVIVRTVKPLPTHGAEAGVSSGLQEQSTQVLEYGLRYEDLERLVATLPTITRAVPIAMVRRTAQHARYRLPNARILGTVPEYKEIKNLELQRGRFLTDLDIKTTANVAVLGAGAARRLFSYEDPLEKTVLLGLGAYKVVGLLQAQDSGAATAGAVGQDDFNNDIYVPLSAARSRFGELEQVPGSAGAFERTQLSEITLSVMDETLVSQTAAMAKSILRRSHPTGEDFEVQVPLELLRQAEREKQIWNLVLGSIAGISLLVGGVGIMNIMLATVTERTREIGIRRAVGAKRWHITAQFLTETALLAGTGGLLGIVAGIGLAFLISSASSIEVAFRWWSILLAFGISVGIGIGFGYYPARRAALMDPIAALRHE